MSGEETAPPAEGTIETGLAAEGELRWVAADISSPLEYVRRRLDLYPVAAAALGRCLAAAPMLLRLTSRFGLRRAERLVIEVDGAGPLRKVMAESDEAGNLRGLVGNGQPGMVATGEGKLPVGEAVGLPGQLRVLKEFADGGRYQSQTELVSGEIGLDVAHYLEQSEQRRSAVLLGVLARPDGVAAAGGLVVEVLPGATEETVAGIESNIAAIAGVSRVLEHGGVDGIVEAVLGSSRPRRHERQGLRYRCRCERQRLRQQLVLLSAEDLDELHVSGEAITAECGFCGEVYVFEPEELGVGGEVVN